MKILFLSYGIIEYDGRLKELIKVANNIGDTEVYCLTISNDKTLFKISKKKHISAKTIFKFYLKVIYKYNNLSKYDVIFVDNYFVAPIALLLKYLNPKIKIIQDVREFYLLNEMKTLKSKIFVYSEIKLMKISNVVISANKYRSDYMDKIYKLKERPICFENIRFLEDTDYNLGRVSSKIIFDNNHFNIISTGGLSVSRGILKILESAKKLGNKYHFYIIGGGTQKDKSIVNNYIDEKNIVNVTLIDKVPMTELKTLVNKADIGLVNYHMDDLNNKYCASGKIYEYLNEGLPIVTTENIPLKDLCLNHKIGVACNDFEVGIRMIEQNIEKYKENVISFIKNISPKKYNREIADEIYEKLLKDE